MNKFSSLACRMQKVVFVSVLLLLPHGVNSAELSATGAGPIGVTLEDFFTAALDYSPSLRIAEETLNIGSARYRQARGQLLPQLNANAALSDNERNASNISQEFDGTRYSLQLSQVLFNWQAFAAKKAATFEEDRAEAEYFGELAFILTEVADKYFEVLQSEDALESIASEMEAVRNQRDQIQSYYDLQLAQITDLYEAEAALAAVEAEQLLLQSELALTQEALRSVTGLNVGPIYQLRNDADIPLLVEDINYWVRQAQSGNHSIRAQEFAVKAADERVSERKGAYMPQVNLVLQRQDSDVGFDNVPIARTDNTYIGVNVSIPLYAGGSNRARVSEARSQFRIAENELRATQLQANERVRTAYLQVQSSELRTQAARRLVESTALSAEASQQGFELGTVTTVDVLNALRDQFQAERDLQRTRYEHIRYLLLLKLEAGSLTADDMLEVGEWLEPSQR